MCFYRTLSKSALSGIPIALVLMLSACDTQTGSQEKSETGISQTGESNIVAEAKPPAPVVEPASSYEGPPEIVRATFPDSEGKTYFNEQVLPKLSANGCPVCHMPGAGYVRPEISYDGLFPFLAIGQAADNNIIMFKIANQRSFAPDQPNHPGGKRCENEDADPCKSIKTWWEVEFGDES